MKINSFLKYFLPLSLINWFLLSFTEMNVNSRTLAIAFLIPIFIQSLYWAKKESKIKTSKLRFQILDFFGSGFVILILLVLVANLSLYFLLGDLGVALFILSVALYSVYLLIIDTVVFGIYGFLVNKKGQTLSP